MEDHDQPSGKRIIWYSFKAFVHDWFVQEMTSTMQPTLTESLITYWQAGSPPFLTLSELADANSNSGTHMVVVNYGAPERYTSSEGCSRWIGSKSAEWMPYSCTGYNLKSLFIELYGNHDHEWAACMGFHQYRDYSETMSEEIMTRIDGAKPRLYGIYRERAAVQYHPLHPILFENNRPQFRFSHTEQDFLLHAMAGWTDKELAEMLHCAVVTINKRWASIYSKTSGLASDAICPPATGTDNQTRGAEKKRYILAYLRQHMEELRPYNQ